MLASAAAIIFACELRIVSTGPSANECVFWARYFIDGAAPHSPFHHRARLLAIGAGA